MSATKTANTINITDERNLFPYFPVFKNTIYNQVVKTICDFSKKDYEVRFMGVTTGENIFYFGSEYFVNKIPVNRSSEVKINISSDFINTFLNDILGGKEGKFSLKEITDIEAFLIRDFTQLIYDNLMPYINNAEASKKVLKSSKDYCFTFFIRSKGKHTGKILITLPEYILTNISLPEIPDTFTVSDFKTTYTQVDMSAGYAKISLSELKNLEAEDIIVLDNSNISEMSVLINDKSIPFKIKPNPELVLGVDIEEGGEEEMPGNEETNPSNMWDSILVDVVAEFENVKLTLGDLKQISEGLVVDVGSVYDNKINLKVENKTVASGELVIINDRYGVRVTEVTKMHDENVPQQQAAQVRTKTEPAAAPAAKPAPVQKPAAAKQPAKAPAPKPAAKPKQAPAPGGKGDENFDYKDFEIEDESI